VLTAEVPDTEAEPDTELIDRLIANEATHLVLAEYEIKADGSFATLYRLVPSGEHEHPFALVANTGAERSDQHLVFSSWRAADDAFAWYVGFLRECHKDQCATDDPAKCRHTPVWPPTAPKTARRKKNKTPRKTP